MCHAAWKYRLPIVDNNRLLYAIESIGAAFLHHHLAINFYKYIFGGKIYTAEFNTVPWASMIYYNPNYYHINATVITDANGKAFFEIDDCSAYMMAVGHQTDFAEFYIEVGCMGYAASRTYLVKLE